MNDTLLIGTDCSDVTAFAAVLDADLLTLPPVSDAFEWTWAAELEAWRTENTQNTENTADAAGAAYSRVVVTAWQPGLLAERTVDLDVDGWEMRTEQPLARWVVALGCAVSRVAGGGSVVAVVDGPTSLECAGWAPESAVAEGVRALCRSLALSEGARGVRVNLVSAPARLPVGELLHPAPALDGYPGTLERDVAGAVRMLLSPDAVGVTGGVVHADAGRAWR
jgi:NAD(P)-dependent dehydrogenase (short-subunit alcohol dehydrogenase family)